jgi:hypothetical protein
LGDRGFHIGLLRTKLHFGRLHRLDVFEVGSQLCQSLTSQRVRKCLDATLHFQAQTCTRRDELLVRGVRSILAKFMKDSVVRGCLLQLLYERRSEGSIPFGHAEQAVPPPGGISRRDWLRAVAQLSEYRLIDWTPLEDQSGMGLLSGFATINDFGVKVLEAGVAPPIRISIDERRRTKVPRQQQASIAASTLQQRAITEALEKVITAINQADVSEQEKNGAKSLLRKLLGGKAAAKVLGAGAQSLAAKYFTE